MQIVKSINYQELSSKATDTVVSMMGMYSNPLICVASGDSPAGIYKAISDKVIAKTLNIDHWCFLGLDEWLGLNGNDHGSCRYHLDQQLFNTLKLTSERLHFFDGATENIAQECAMNEQFIDRFGGIQVAILGLGLNGHIGMNEPYTSINTRSHLSNLDPLTIAVGQKYFNKPQPLSQGLTLGLVNLLEAKNVILVVSGLKKAAIVKEIVEGPISEAIPGSLLRNHPNYVLFLDEEAASLLS
jgi:glucosamine-6-phosphate isomerase